MKTSKEPVKCFIAGFENRRIDAYLETNGFSRGMTNFAIPSFGIQFKCRTDGCLIDLEFAALFSLLEFIKTRLKDEQVKEILILSSSPEFVFSFTGQSSHLQPGTGRRRLLDEYTTTLKMAVGYIKPVDNNALVSPADYPSMPAHDSIILQPDARETNKSEFKPFQKGIRLG
ncbi:MAG: hypothetical protein KAU36_04395 [candidate division Zixibacteria bacterium]|nr:hypothetical protein [candidate division Zixibacteria bacterium]